MKLVIFSRSFLTLRRRKRKFRLTIFFRRSRLKVSKTNRFFFYSGESSCESLFLLGDDDNRTTEAATNKKTKNDVDAAMDNLMAHFIKHKISFECLESTVKLMNEMPGTTVKLPATKYKLMKWFKSRCSIECQYHIFCEQCKIYIECSSEKTDKWICVGCGTELRICETNYFVYFKLEDQLKQILHRHWDEIQTYNRTIINDDCENIKDAYSGSLNQAKVQQNILCLMVNTDGISLKKSNKKSVWPVQIICNFLPPHLRYFNENIITVAFYYNEEKPDMMKLFEPLAKELEKLELNGLVFEQQVFRVAVTSAVLDLPAKAAFQQTMQYNGYFGCGFCLHRGEKVGRVVKFPIRNKSVALRKHSDFVEVMSKIYANKNAEINVNGIKGISPAISFEYFDMVKSFALDYMHCVCLGVSKNLYDFWFKPSLKSAAYINKNDQELLNLRIQSIKPCSFINRKPRSFKLRRLMKASEHRNNLLYFLPACLKGILAQNYLDHLNLLSSSIYKLLTTNISSQDLIDVKKNLNIFVEKYQDLYGKEHMTMNVHQLNHIVFCVENLGPLWSQSMFSFESNNATFSRYVIGSTDIIAQLTSRYMIDRSIKRKLHQKGSKTFPYLSVEKTINLNTSEAAILNENNILFENNKVQAYCVYSRHDQRYTSMSYTAAKKTIDYFVELKHGILGKVKYYFERDNVYYMVLEQYESLNQVNHLCEVATKNIHLVCLAEDIEKKFIYIHFLNKHFITERPNAFESD